MSSSSTNRQELDSVLPDDINAELDLWKQLVFDTDMPSPLEKRHDDHPGQDDDSGTPSSSQIPSPHFQVLHAVPPPLPPETYNYLIHALLSLQGSASHAHYPPSYPHPFHSSPNCHYPWPPGTAPSISTASIESLSSFYSTNPPVPLPSRTVPQSAGSLQFTPSPAASSTTVLTEQDPEETEDAVVTEDKRRRNTAASARFRVKKKLKTLNLERTVADLTGRSEELEREATDLRRENAWLKEIVLLKGRNITALTLGSQAPAPGNRHGEGIKDDNTHAESEPDSTCLRARKSSTFPRDHVFEMSFGRPPSINVGFQATPPDRGSFPLDHDGECRDKMMQYMACLKKNSSASTPCRSFSKQYLECRMSKGLMERDNFKNLGLGDIDNTDISNLSKDRNRR
ncbi:hypothetical protein J3R83DRAFT_6812 [Lanmaoa asiatica]|nr:hypothetical protein J3R83DRAFT_6812 [Lanmaoa asiatica]